MRCSKKHMETNEMGIGSCSVPMWGNGVPSGFCDKEAYGEHEDSKIYDGYVPYLACPAHGGPKTRVYKDGNKWCAVFPDFINIQESEIGFGDTPEEARKALKGGE